MTQLVKDEGEALLVESAQSKSSDDIKKMIEQLNVESEQSVNAEEETVQEELPQEPAAETEAFEPQVNQTIEQDEPPVQPKGTEKPIDVQAIYKQAQMDLLSTLQSQQAQQQQPVKPTEPAKTKEQLLEEFTEDPQGFLDRAINPYREQIVKMEEEQIYSHSRLYNKDFARVEPLVRKIFQTEPYLGKNLPPAKKVELGYLIALGLERQKQTMESTQKEESEKAKRLKDKQVAGSIPKTQKKDTPAPKKDPYKMTLAELEKEIRSLTG